MSLSITGIRRTMLKSSPGDITKDAVDLYRKILLDLTQNIMPDARQLATSAGRKRVNSDDIKFAASKWTMKRL